MTPWQLLSKLERLNEVPNETIRLRQFQEQSCGMFAEFLPPAAGGWLEVARRYQLGQATDADLDSVRNAAWEHLESHACEFSDVHILAVRAVFCLLFPDGTQHREDEPPRQSMFEMLHTFLERANMVVSRTDEQTQILLDLFPELSR